MQPYMLAVRTGLLWLIFVKQHYFGLSNSILPQVYQFIKMNLFKGIEAP